MTVSLLWGVVGCGSIIYDDYPDEKDSSENFVWLALNVAPIVSTRASEDIEKMYSLRIVLLSDDEGSKGKVEYNARIDFASGQTAYKEGVPNYHFIRTEPGKKKIFLVANEESITRVKMVGVGPEFNDQSLTTVLGSRTANSETDPGDFEDLVNAISFAPGTYEGMNIPLSSSYSFDIPEGETLHKQTFYLVHAATKFEFKFINERESAVRIDALSISSLAEDMYLMANFGETQATQKKVSWTQNGTARSAYWIDWLREVSDATTSNPADPDNERVNGIYGWISDYELPPTEHNIRNLIAGDNPVFKQTYDIPVASAETPSVTLPTVYFPESKNISAAAANRQDYSFSVTLTDTGSNTFREFKDIRLNYIESQENLVTLFRNTHVKVTCTVGYEAQEMTLNLLIGICPWNYEEINIPTFD